MSAPALDASAAETPRAGQAALWMLGAIVSFSSMAVAGRAVSFELDTFEIMLYRSLAGIPIVLGAAALAGRTGEIRAARMGLHLIRNTFHFLGQNCWYLALTLIPLAQVFALEFTGPIWAILFAPLVLGERITSRGLAAAALGFAGILIVARPGFGAFDPGLVAAAVAAIGFGFTALFTRRLTRTESTVSILLWLTVMQAGMSLVFAGVDGDIALPSAPSLLPMAVISVGGLVAHYCLTTALSLAPAAKVMPIDFARLPLIAVVGMVLYGEALDPLVFLGAGLIVLGNWVNLRRPRRA
ncbi:DMT family transporter [Wenxinia saemankumensis]|uniref:Permease of the drug/metabolite transporter (DMT) superfamily n=1 Tax=Wenxinia saemankumensis TaxID=1447782 RepID=A0A1M6HHT2_9RHOB|nr:DMT family transporter [Wenxinia saemankumensis]SHJ21770.1 Permease of the drug/metabolite transporter (DMT) superfamily [Wenxinia saemankumensis]